MGERSHPKKRKWKSNTWPRDMIGVGGDMGGHRGWMTLNISRFGDTHYLKRKMLKILNHMEEASRQRWEMNKARENECFPPSMRRPSCRTKTAGTKLLENNRREYHRFLGVSQPLLSIRAGITRWDMEVSAVSKDLIRDHRILLSLIRRIWGK